MQTYDVVMIGAGHNGLVCAAYLLKAGYSVLLLEKKSIPGGGATREEVQLANYTTPIHGLYLTGAGTHPGGQFPGCPDATALVSSYRRSIPCEKD